MEFCPRDGTRLSRQTGTQAAVSDPHLGKLLHGRYRIEERIGRGGMGVVYRAIQVNIDRPVAIKLLTAEAAEKDDVVRRFENEAKIISSLRHPNTLKLIDYGRTDDGQLFVVTEFLDGQPLDALLAAGPISERRTVQVLEQVCASLAEAHEQGVVHRDLKPGNLFLENVGSKEVVKVLDFGIARLSTGTSHTQTGMVFGTPAYMSPEQCRGERVDARSDLYSLGIVAYECLTGRPPFMSETPVSLLLKHIHDPVPPLEELEPPVGVHPTLSALVMRLLAKDADARCSSAAEVEAVCRRLDRALPAVVAGAHPPFSTGETLDSASLTPTSGSQAAATEVDAGTTPMPTRESSRRPALVVALVASLAGTAVGAWALLGGGQTQATEPETAVGDGTGAATGEPTGQTGPNTAGAKAPLPSALVAAPPDTASRRLALPEVGSAGPPPTPARVPERTAGPPSDPAPTKVRASRKRKKRKKGKTEGAPAADDDATIGPAPKGLRRVGADGL